MRPSLIVARFVHAPAAEDLEMPAADVHLILAESGRTTVSSRVDGQPRTYEWVPGRIGLKHPDQSVTCTYRADKPLRSLQVHIPRGIVERSAEQLGQALDYERMAASLKAGDPLLTEVLHTVNAAVRNEVGDLYAESAATFLAVHLLTHHSGQLERPVPVREDIRVRTAIAVMRDRLADPLTLADIAREVYLSVFHLVRVFKETTGETPHRYLTRLRVQKAQNLLRTSTLTIAEIASHCGFATPGALSTAFLRHTGMRPSTYRDS